ncbi:hypothetical protein ACSITO_000365 [Enterobacter hormaechei]|uniref:Gp38 n=1 Tax=Enterobacter asburiae TaxID=61645 RepID=A0A376F6U5_ENTAS|nr:MULTISPECIES: hypothetical protein [Enterobacter cloacae complex]EEW7581499.1 hypothetical protein [Escherichia coli]EKS6353444.1 hypothetical protein [Enterobacter hormaechei]AMA03110.1 hypothetical protein ACJ69_05360 [Enterobacter asburiae]EFK2028509.1 hypothetical protein [Escherichia coli]EKG8104676.1 hypothetical protein [Escherichia coli]
MSNKEYEQAFPTRDDNYDSKYSGPGMTLRDYFAAKAMQGIISSECNYGAFSDLASDAYSIADAMLRAREAS